MVSIDHIAHIVVVAVAVAVAVRLAVRLSVRHCPPALAGETRKLTMGQVAAELNRLGLHLRRPELTASL